MRHADDELDAWVRLIHWPGLGRESMRKLLAAFGSVTAVARAPHSARRAVLGPRTEVSAVPDERHAQQLAATKAWLNVSESRRLITLGEDDYPAILLHTVDPPLWLYAEGDASLLQSEALAIVGSRQATPQGLENARAFGRDLAGRGWVIVSGLAAGIDAAAHEGALEASVGAQTGAGGNTIAVVGTGLDQVYPRSNRGLAARITERGLMLSEFPLGTPPIATHFPLRNRIIATLTRGTLVVEAAAKSGSLITARLAAEAGREVFAIPGSIHSPQSRGCHDLLKQGAKLVETAEDVLEELGAGVDARPKRLPALAGSSGERAAEARSAPSPMQSSSSAANDTSDPAFDASSEPADGVLRAMGHDPSTLDALMARCGWPASELTARLLELELAGQVARLPGGLYQRIRST